MEAIVDEQLVMSKREEKRDDSVGSMDSFLRMWMKMEEKREERERKTDIEREQREALVREELRKERVERDRQERDREEKLMTWMQAQLDTASRPITAVAAKPNISNLP